jgi:cytochrome P450
MSLLSTAKRVVETVAQIGEAMPYYGGSELLGGAMRDLTDAPTDVFDTLVREGADIVKTRLGPIRTYLVFNADYAGHILQANAKNYTRPAFFSDLLRASSGLNVFSAEGEDWRRRRKILSPPFRPSHLHSLGSAVSREAARHVERWETAPSPLDVQDEMTRLSLNVVGSALFGVDMQTDPRGRELTDGFAGSTRWLNHKRKHVFAAPLFIPTSINLGLKQGKAKVHRVLRELLDERRRSGVEKPDMMQMLMAVRDKDTGEPLTADEIVDEMATFFFAGHETTANTLTWALYLVSKHPDVEAQVLEEITRVLGGRAPTFDDVPALPRARAIIEEALRLYPPAWAILRQATEDDRLGPHLIRAGSVIYVAVYGIQRSPRYWDAPEQFRPDRFFEAPAEPRHPHAFLPFGAGPRACMGSHFAMYEAQLILSTLLQRYRLRAAPGVRAEPETIFTLRVRGGLPMTLEKLQSGGASSAPAQAPL